MRRGSQRVREGPSAVRTDDRHVPGDQAPLRGDAGVSRAGGGCDLGRGPRRRTSRPAATRRLDRRARSADGLSRCAKSNIQVHGGIGYTWEHDAHLHLRRAGSLQSLFGPVDDLARQITELAARALCAPTRSSYRPRPRGTGRTCGSSWLDIEGLEARARDAAFLEEGYAQPQWPRPWGRSAGAVEQLVIDQEMKGIHRPGTPGIGGWITLTVIRTPPPTRRGGGFDPAWSARSDVPVVQRARRRLGCRGNTDPCRSGGGGLGAQRQIWTSGAQVATHGLATVRTDPRPPSTPASPPPSSTCPRQESRCGR